MSMIKKKEVMTMAMLAEEIHTQQSSPIFVSVIKQLRDLEVIKIKPYLGNTKLVEIDNKKLTNIIDDDEIVNYFYKYFHEWHVITW